MLSDLANRRQTMISLTVSLLCFLLVGIFADNGPRAIRQTVDDLEQRILALENSLETCGCTPSSPVAFKAHFPHSINPGLGQTIVFDDVQLNLGQSYHSHNGMFVTPRNGLYFFSVSICSGNGHFVILDLVKNGVMIGRVLAGDTAYSDCSSETTVVQLSKGDEVYVKHLDNMGDMIEYSSTLVNSFTGALLQSM